MAAIQGLPDITKEDVASYCRRHNMTQIEWVKQHLREDLKAEQTQQEEKTSDQT